MATEQKSVGFTLAAISTDQFACSPEHATDLHTATDVELTSGLNFGVNREERVVVVYVKAEFKQGEHVVFSVEIGCHFTIEEESWPSLLRGEDVVIPKALATHLSFLAMGTLRGVVYVKSEPLLPNGLVLPLMNVAEVLTEDVVISVH